MHCLAIPLRRQTRSALAWSLVCCCLVVSSPAAALKGKLIGGPGYALWHATVDGQTRPRSGVGRGISGMGAYEIGAHLRITSGLLQAELTLDDNTQLSRQLFFVGLRGAMPLSHRWYASAGAEVGASRLKLSEAVAVSSDGYVKMAFSERWTVAVQPVASIGFRPRPKYHLEVMFCAPTERHGGAWRTSFAVMFGLFFWMGAGAQPAKQFSSARQ